MPLRADARTHEDAYKTYMSSISSSSKNRTKLPNYYIGLTVALEHLIDEKHRDDLPLEGSVSRR
jgi:hypothetical protein